MQATDVQLPDKVATKGQLLKLIREVEKIQEQALQGHVRKEQTGQDFVVSQPSNALLQVLEAMGRELTLEALKDAHTWLLEVRKVAPTIRIVFSAEPDHETTKKVVNWFRDNSGMPVLLRVGVQPSIAGGCIVYTPTHRYDFSLKHQILSGDSRITDVMRRIT